MLESLAGEDSLVSASRDRRTAAGIEIYGRLKGLGRWVVTFDQVGDVCLFAGSGLAFCLCGGGIFPSVLLDLASTRTLCFDIILFPFLGPPTASIKGRFSMATYHSFDSHLEHIANAVRMSKSWDFTTLFLLIIYDFAISLWGGGFLIGGEKPMAWDRIPGGRRCLWERFFFPPFFFLWRWFCSFG